MGRLKAAFHTLGCKVNSYETEAMAELLKNAGYEIVPFAAGADVYIINTCTVTAIADKKSRQMLHRAKEMNPGAVVCAVGCYAEDSAGSLKGDDAVDLIIGNAMKSSLPDILAAHFDGSAVKPENYPVSSVKEYDGLSISTTADRTRASIKIQDGCNQFCTYCMIPYVRGRVRSRKEEEVIAEAARLAAEGFREVVLTGIHISSYGLDFDYPGENLQTPMASEAESNSRLIRLIEKTAAIPGIRRVRLGSLEPGIVTPGFIESLSGIPEFCPHFHLSLQSGSDTVLSRMNRRYRRDDYRSICKLIRSRFPDAAITTDIITGFPGETDAEFEETMQFAEEIGFSRIHVFKYSRRKGTRAADFPGQVPERKKKERSDRLIGLGRTLSVRYAERFLGRETEVLFEEETGTKGEFRGCTREYVEVLSVSEENLKGSIRTCLITRICPDGTAVGCAGSEKTIEYQADTE